MKEKNVQTNGKTMQSQPKRENKNGQANKEQATNIEVRMDAMMNILAAMITTIRSLAMSANSMPSKQGQNWQNMGTQNQGQLETNREKALFVFSVAQNDMSGVTSSYQAGKQIGPASKWAHGRSMAVNESAVGITCTNPSAKQHWRGNDKSIDDHV